MRLSNFAEMFLIDCNDQWFLRWAPTFCGTLVKKASQTPRISKLYSLLKTAMQICSKHKYFDSDELALRMDDTQAERADKQSIYETLLSFFKELISKQEEY